MRPHADRVKIGRPDGVLCEFTRCIRGRNLNTRSTTKTGLDLILADSRCPHTTAAPRLARARERSRMCRSCSCPAPIGEEHAVETLKAGATGLRDQRPPAPAYPGDSTASARLRNTRPPEG